MNKKNSSVPKRDISADRKKLKKIFVVIVSAFLALALLLGVLFAVSELLRPSSDSSYDVSEFFPADYTKNIFEDELYLHLDRGIYYKRHETERILTESTIGEFTVAASFFYDYFNCIINGDYQNYPFYFTESCLNDPAFVMPEKFTMQALYDIHIELYEVKADPSVEGASREIYTVRYRIFENNGTFRTDILPGETRTLVYELIVQGDVVKINAIGYRNDGNP